MVYQASGSTVSGRCAVRPHTNLNCDWACVWTVPGSIPSGKDIAQASKRQGRAPWAATTVGCYQSRSRRWQYIGEREALRSDGHDKEECHGDYTTARQTTGYY